MFPEVRTSTRGATTPRAGYRPEQQVVQRRVREHDADQRAGRARRGRRRRRYVGGGREHDRAGRGLQCGRLLVVDRRQLAGSSEVGHHHGEGLVDPAFANPQSFTAASDGRVAGQVVAPDALDRNDLAGHQAPLRGGEHRVGPDQDLRVAFEGDARAARRAGDGLGVVSAVARVVVLGAHAGHMANPSMVVDARS